MNAHIFNWDLRKKSNFDLHMCSRIYADQCIFYYI